MKSRAVLCVGLLVALIAGVPAGADERVVRGFHQGRAYRLYVPALPAPDRPLIVALHGCSQTPDDFALGTRLDKAAARRGLRVLYPAQRRFDNVARCWNWFAPADGETTAILALARETLRTTGSDDTRIVVLGLSAGGYMAVNLTCAAPDLVVGVGVMAGGPYRCAHGAAGAISCMRGEHLDGSAAAVRCKEATGKSPTARASLWHGDGDSVVSPANFVALTEMFVALREPRPSGVTERHDSVVRSLYRTDGDGAAVLETWFVLGMGHAWSGGDARGTHTYPAGPDATEAMLRFLLSE
jgi:poly(hydroxyalkanoate) depolymerase family esterase